MLPCCVKPALSNAWRRFNGGDTDAATVQLLQHLCPPSGCNISRPAKHRQGRRQRAAGIQQQLGLLSASDEVLHGGLVLGMRPGACPRCDKSFWCCGFASLGFAAGCEIICGRHDSPAAHLSGVVL
jgi:hypothetical protein